jgi:hypothetical protein
MSIDSSEAANSLRDISEVERRTREAIFYADSSAIFIMWGVLVACGYALSAGYPQSSRIIWLVVPLLGCAATVLIILLRRHTRAGKARISEPRDLRFIWAMAALSAFGAVWSYLLAPVVPRLMMYAFQPSLFLLGFVLAGLWLGRFFVVLGLVGLALIMVGYAAPEPWLRLWMAVVQSGTLIIGGVWLGRVGIPR